MAPQIDGTVDEHPPEVRLLTLMEQLDAGLDANLGTALGQFRELIVGQAAEQADRAQVLAAHHIIAWLLMRSSGPQTTSALPTDLASANGALLLGRPALP
jgi:hypothetical protein